MSQSRKRQFEATFLARKVSIDLLARSTVVADEGGERSAGLKLELKVDRDRVPTQLEAAVRHRKQIW
ncbi:MAG: hypothetical protein H0U12_05380 [Thermoleophilaceae bacterium]|nr:hypothetical protein [Thermoleophilaceae bacterium]